MNKGGHVKLLKRMNQSMPIWTRINLGHVNKSLAGVKGVWAMRLGQPWPNLWRCLDTMCLMKGQYSSRRRPLMWEELTHQGGLGFVKALILEKEGEGSKRRLLIVYISEYLVCLEKYYSLLFSRGLCCLALGVPMQGFHLFHWGFLEEYLLIWSTIRL